MTRGGYKVLTLCVLVVAGMLALTLYSVRLYKLFCQQTGFGGTPKQGRLEDLTRTMRDTPHRQMTIYFDSNVDPDLPWTFAPQKTSMKITVGVPETMIYRVKNLTNHPLTGVAVFNVTPPSIGAYFIKTQCFCFTNQPLAAGEEKDMPVIFYLDPGLEKDSDLDGVTSMTLSYTFFPKL